MPNHIVIRVKKVYGPFKYTKTFDFSHSKIFLRYLISPKFSIHEINLYFLTFEFLNEIF